MLEMTRWINWLKKKDHGKHRQQIQPSRKTIRDGGEAEETLHSNIKTLTPKVATYETANSHS